MRPRNNTIVTVDSFGVIRGCYISFVMFLAIYSDTLIGNVSIIMLIRSNPHLHDFMGYFLSYLAFVNIGYSSSVTPIMLKVFLTFIFVSGCISQLCSVVTFG